MTAPLPLVAMLPLKIARAHYDENIERTRLLLESFERFSRFPSPLPVYAVCLRAELPRVREAFSRYERVTLELLCEEDLVPGIGGHGAIGWFKQQALKLAFSRICPAPFYLTLDPDILLCRALHADDLVRDGRCYTSWMTKAEHPHWWAASAALLGVAVDPTTPGMNVTPQMLSRDVAQALGRLLTALLGGDDPWLALLDVKTRWTEYTLYSIFAEATGRLAEYHRPDLPRGRRLLGRSVWQPSNFENYSLIDIHDDDSGAFFTVCASHTKVPAALLRGMFDALMDRVGA
jgi:hypothetical protein